MDKLPWATMTLSLVVLIVAIVGGIAVMTEDTGLSFQDYIEGLSIIGAGLGAGVGIGRGINAASKNNGS